MKEVISFLNKVIFWTPCLFCIFAQNKMFVFCNGWRIRVVSEAIVAPCQRCMEFDLQYDGFNCNRDHVTEARRPGNISPILAILHHIVFNLTNLNTINSKTPDFATLCHVAPHLATSRHIN